jgi:isoleucyl-tRNA synthetase
MEKTIPKGWQQAEFPTGNIFLNTETTEDLLGEGYARELMRRLQSFRKDAGLKKKDSIELHFKLDKELEKYIAPFIEQIKTRVGAKMLEIGEHSKKKHMFQNSGEIKGLKFEAGFEVV